MSEAAVVTGDREVVLGYDEETKKGLLKSCYTLWADVCDAGGLLERFEIIEKGDEEKLKGINFVYNHVMEDALEIIIELEKGGEYSRDAEACRKYIASLGGQLEGIRNYLKERMDKEEKFPRLDL
jgi:hypothetical protein